MRRSLIASAFMGIVLAAGVFLLTSCKVGPNRGPAPVTHTPVASQPTTSPAATTGPTIYTQWPFDAKEARRRQNETAKAWGVRKEITLELDPKVKMKLVLIPPGRFIMGTGLDQDPGRQEPAHEVVISRPFYMGICHVTRAQFAVFARETNFVTNMEKRGQSRRVDDKGHAVIQLPDGTLVPDPRPDVNWRKPGFDQSVDHPAVCITYDDAMAFCEWLSNLSGRNVSLPTEAQWEYAARAGVDRLYLWGDNPDDGKGWCNAADASARKIFGAAGAPLASTWNLAWRTFKWDDGYAFTSPVGKFRCNNFGLYDILGNARQCCEDVYDPSFYFRSPREDPCRPPNEEGEQSRVVRGASYASAPRVCRLAYRAPQRHDLVGADIGFRVVVPVK